MSDARGEIRTPHLLVRSEIHIGSALSINHLQRMPTGGRDPGESDSSSNIAASISQRRQVAVAEQSLRDPSIQAGC